jgi:hypothetical protein
MAYKRTVEQPKWHRITLDDSSMNPFNAPARCSCGGSWAEGAFAIGHAYSANAILEDELWTAYDKLDEDFGEFVRSEHGW